MNHITPLLLALVPATAAIVLAAEPDLSKLPPPSDKTGLTYAADIRPIFEASCFRCHGEERPKHGLRLDSLEAALKGSEDGKVIVPGKSKESPLVIAVAQLDDETAMPPKRRPGGPGGRGGRGGFGPGMMLAPQMISQADRNGDKKVTKEEFTALADTWFEKMDTQKAGRLSQQEFVSKMSEVLPPPQGRGPQGGGQPPGNGQRPGGGRGGFGPGMFVGPGLFSAADADKDGSVTRAELKDTFAKWFTAWDKEKTDSLAEADIRDGLNASLPPPNFGGRGPGGGFGPGGPGGPGGGGPGGPGDGGPRGFGGPGGGPGGPGGGNPPKPLTPEQVGLVRAWIDQGAK